MVPEDMTSRPWQGTITARVIVVGGSSGAVLALRRLLAAIWIDVPIVVVVHVSNEAGAADVLERGVRGALLLPVCTVLDKMPLTAGCVYLCPPGYHVLIERTSTLALSVEGKVNHCRPAIDVLFESAADAFGNEVLGVILSGANADGAKGAHEIRRRGGTLGVQDPARSEASEMPAATIARVHPHMVGNIDDLRGMLASVRFPQ